MAFVHILHKNSKDCWNCSAVILGAYNDLEKARKQLRLEILREMKNWPADASVISNKADYWKIVDNKEEPDLFTEIKISSTTII